MGEFWSLTHDERTHIMDTLADEARDGWPIGAHVTHTSAPEMLSLARHAERAGFDVLIVAPPYMVTKTEEQVIEYVQLLAENSNLAIMFYNSPQFGIVMSPSGLERLCRIPNVVGLKEASFNQQLSIETHLSLGKDYVISTPDEWIFWKGKELGLPAAGDVFQYFGLAVRHAGVQQLRPVRRAGHARETWTNSSTRPTCGG